MKVIKLVIKATVTHHALRKFAQLDTPLSNITPLILDVMFAYWTHYITMGGTSSVSQLYYGEAGLYIQG